MHKLTCVQANHIENFLGFVTVHYFPHDIPGYITLADKDTLSNDPKNQGIRDG
jgi:hypothetical protein